MFTAAAIISVTRWSPMARLRELASVSLRVGEPVKGGGVGGRRGDARQRPDHRDRCGGAVGVVGGHSYSVAVADREYAEMESCFNYL